MQTKPAAYSIPAATDRLFLGHLVVLHIESSVLEQDVLADILRGFGVRRANRCSSAAEACERLAQEPADLLVTGTDLGDMTGFEFVRWLRGSRLVCRDAPVVLAMGHADRTRVVQALDCGVSFVVAKPVTPAVLFERLQWLAQDRRATWGPGP